MRVHNLASAILLATGALAASPAAAGGYAAPDASVRSLGRANAGAVADPGADAIAWNPAAIAGAERELYAGGVFRRTDTELSDRGSTIARAGGPAAPVGGAASVSDPTPDYAYPNFAVAAPVGGRLAAGLSVSRPFHLKTGFPAGYFGRYDTLSNRIDVTQVRAALAFRVNDALDLGLALDGQHMDAALDAASPNLSPLLPDAVTRLKADGWNFGWSAGAQARIGQATVGFAYASSVEHELDGTLSLSGLLPPLDGANFSAPTKVKLSTPWTATLGASWQAAERLRLHAQVQRTGWSEYKTIDLAFAGTGQSIDQLYRDTTAVAVGLDYGLSERWTLRGGLGFDPTPTPDNIREAGVADSDRIAYAVGATAVVSPALKLDLALSYADFQGARLFRDIGFYQGTPAASTAQLRGQVEGSELTAAAALRWGF